MVANRVEPWTGVRNHTAKNNLIAMRKGDLAFFYHSNIGKQIVGIVRVERESYPDPSAETGNWVCVDMKAVRPLPKPVTLAEIKADPRIRRISAGAAVAPVGRSRWTEAYWDRICAHRRLDRLKLTHEADAPDA